MLYSASGRWHSSLNRRYLRMMMPTCFAEQRQLPPVRTSYTFAGQLYVEVNSCHLRWCCLRRTSALATRDQAQRLLSDDPTRHAGGQSGWCVCDRPGDCLLHLVLGDRSGMAFVGDHRLLWRANDFFDFFRRTDDRIGRGSAFLGSRYGRGTCRGLGSDDFCRCRHDVLGEEFDLMPLPAAGAIHRVGMAQERTRRPAWKAHSCDST